MTIKISSKVKFKDKMFGEKSPYFPFYEAYKNHEFVVDRFMVDGGKEISDHVFLKCTTDKKLIVDGFIELDQLVDITPKLINKFKSH